MLLTVTVNWDVIWVVFLFIVNCYLIFAAAPSGLVLHVILLCVTCIVLMCIFVYSLVVCVIFCCGSFSCVLECHLHYQQCFCLIHPGGIVLLLWVPLCVYSSWCSACLCDVYHVWSVTVDMISSPYHCVMCPWSTIFLLNCYSRP